ncbi:alanine racemase [Streptomyces alkaliphilus]|uniref:alanine racemase n=1 Tax=Streptomyces alkaliphilus TaxID=1472722 RepID=UPI00117E475F|nr:alanine racemase [Streptomyces alkaliphilus]MQS06180.1 alanine racemase [Streptomyces alkaliphilus]
MALTLYVDTDRWRAHQRSVLADFPDLIPVCKGNGYGFGHERLAEEVSLLELPMIAVGTTYEAARMRELFSGDILVLTPYRRNEEPVPLPDRVVRSASSVDGVYGLVGSRVVVEVMSSMRRHGVTPGELGKLRTALEDVRLEGFAIHLPLDRTDGTDAVEEVIGWMDRLRSARLPLDTMFVSHLSAEELARLRQQFPQTRFRARIGTRLWLGDHEATDYRGTVLDVTPVAKGDRFGYRQQKAPGDGWLAVVAGGTSHGVGLEAPKALHGMTSRAKGVARAGLATVNRNLSPFVWDGRQRWFAEPPHMQVSILFVPGEAKGPQVGDEMRAILRHTTTQYDRVVES